MSMLTELEKEELKAYREKRKMKGRKTKKVRLLPPRLPVEIMSREWQDRFDENWQFSLDISELAPKTIASYGQSWEAYIIWCVKNKRVCVPATEETLIAYARHLVDVKSSQNAANNNMLCVTGLHKRSGLKDFRNPDACMQIIRGAKRNGDLVNGKQAKPLTYKILNDALRSEAFQNATSREYIGGVAAMVALDTGTRFSEALSFRMKDVIEEEDGSATVFLTHSKTDQLREGSYKKLSKQTWGMVQYATRRWNLHSPFVVSTHYKMDTMKAHNRMNFHKCYLDKFFKLTGLKGYTTHSFRVGFAHDAYDSGVDIHDIMAYVGWKSMASAQRYLKVKLANGSAGTQVFDQRK